MMATEYQYQSVITLLKKAESGEQITNQELKKALADAKTLDWRQLMQMWVHQPSVEPEYRGQTVCEFLDIVSATQTKLLDEGKQTTFSANADLFLRALVHQWGKRSYSQISLIRFDDVVNRSTAYIDKLAKVVTRSIDSLDGSRKQLVANARKLIQESPQLQNYGYALSAYMLMPYTAPIARLNQVNSGVLSQITAYTLNYAIATRLPAVAATSAKLLAPCARAVRGSVMAACSSAQSSDNGPVAAGSWTISPTISQLPGQWAQALQKAIMNYHCLLDTGQDISLTGMRVENFDQSMQTQIPGPGNTTS